MEITLYKYTKHISEFVDNPVLKNTLFSELNDPFEMRLSEYQERQVQDRFPLIQEKYNMGVISLSKNPRNLQMWAHYADEHRGGLIEFTFQLDGPDFWYDEMTKICEGYIDYTNLFKDVPLCYAYFGSVDYRNSREILVNKKPYHEHFAISENEAKNAIKFIKSLHWGHECEYRFLLDIIYSQNTVAYICGENEENDKIFLELLDRGFYDKELQHTVSGNVYTFNIPSSHGEDGRRMRCLISDCVRKNLPLRILIDINPDTVTGLYFGYRYDTNKLDCKGFEKFKNLNNNINQVSLCPDTFDLKLANRIY